MKNNKGLTLIELLVAIAMISIIMIAITGFILTGSKTFSKGNIDAQIQREAQLAVNQVGDLIIDCCGGVDLELSQGGTPIDLSSVTTAEELEEKKQLADQVKLILYNMVKENSGMSYTKEEIGWTKAAKTLTYSKWKVNYDSSLDEFVVVGSPIYQEELLANKIEKFSVDLSDTLEKKDATGKKIDLLKSVQIQLAYLSSEGKVSYETSPIITLRNRMMKSKLPGMIFEKPSLEDDTIKLYISADSENTAVPIQDRVTQVEKGKNYNIYALIELGDNVNDLCNWKLEETTDSSIDSDGILKVAGAESMQYLTITASYKNNPSKMAKGVVKVAGMRSDKSLEGVTIMPTELLFFNPTFTAYPTVSGFTEEEIKQIQYTWSMKPVQPVTCDQTISAGANYSLFFSKEDSKNYGATVQISVEAYSPTTGEKQSATVSYKLDKYQFEGDSYFERGKTSNVETSIKYPVPEEYKVYGKSEYFFCNEVGERLDYLNNYLQFISITTYAEEFFINIQSGLPRDRGYYLYVKSSFWSNETIHNPKVYEKILYIPKVTITGSVIHYPWDLAKVSNSPFSIFYSISGFYHTLWNVNNPIIEMQSVELETKEGYEGTLVSVSRIERNYQTVDNNYRFAAPIYFHITPPDGKSLQNLINDNGIRIKSIVFKVSTEGNIYDYCKIIFD